MEKPTLINLQMLKTQDGGVIRIMEESANCYKCVGHILLNDRYGDRVDTIVSDERGRGGMIIQEIYKLWMREYPDNCSWATLTECFRECGLNRLARTIEQNFGLPSPSLPEVTAPNGNACLYQDSSSDYTLYCFS